MLEVLFGLFWIQLSISFQSANARLDYCTRLVVVDFSSLLISAELSAVHGTERIINRLM